MTKDWTIHDIESLTEPEAQKMALETLTIKDHTVYLVDFGGYFGYSALIFAENHHIHYANDYELHHNGKTRDELRGWYLSTLPNKLFTEQEIAEPVRSYTEYKQKDYYLRNYYAQRRDHVSMFYISGNDPAADAARQQKIKDMIPDPIAFAYYAKSDEDFVRHHIRLYADLMHAKQSTLDNFDYWKSAFVHEMYNHEYAINWDADFDTLSEFGNLRPTRAKNELAHYFKQLGFTAVQKKAYLAAREQYMREQEIA